MCDFLYIREYMNIQILFWWLDWKFDIRFVTHLDLNHFVIHFLFEFYIYSTIYTTIKQYTLYQKLVEKKNWGKKKQSKYFKQPYNETFGC